MELLSMFKFVICLLTTCNSNNDNIQDLQMSSTLQNASFSSVINPINPSNDNENELDPDRATPIGLLNVRNKRASLLRGQDKVEQYDLLHVPTETKNGNGVHCKFNTDCQSGCCVAPSRDDRQCAPMGLAGDRCESAQVKGGYYVDHCPCLAGDEACVRTARGRVRHLTCER